MSQRNGDRSRSHVQRRHKAALRVRRRKLLTGEDKPIAKIVSIDGKKTSDNDKASRL